MSTVNIYSQAARDNQFNMELRGRWFTADWDLPRNLSLTYNTPLSGEAAANQAFKITNAPEDALTEEEADMVTHFRGPSLSIGDVVEVDGIEYLCAPEGWRTDRPLPARWRHRLPLPPG